METLGANELALEEITKLIMAHEYKPGDCIMETSLADKLNLSRTPIRDALSRLVSTGFIEKRKGQKGYQIPSLTPEDMYHIFQTRSLLEGYTARMAARSGSSKDVEVLQDLNEREIRAFFNKERKKYATLNQNFHLKLAQMTNNPYIYRFIEQVFWRSRLYIFFFAEFYNFNHTLRNYRLEHQRLSHQEHHLLIQSIAEADEGKAEQLMQEHILKTYQHLLNPQSIFNKSDHESIRDL